MPNNHQKHQRGSPGPGQHQKKKKKKTKKKQQLTVEMEQESTLRHLQDMFKDVLDPVLTHTILEEHNFVVEEALETLFPLAEEAGKSSDKVIPSFKDIKDRLSRSHGDDDSDDEDDEDDNDISESDERIEEENSSNEYKYHNLDLPLLPKSSLNNENEDVSGMPFSPARSTRNRNVGNAGHHTTASSEVDVLLARHRESNLHRDDYSNLQSLREEIPPHSNGYSGAFQPWPQRNNTHGMMYMGSHGQLNSYYQLPAGIDSAQTQSSQDYLNTYYRDTLQLQRHANIRSQNSHGGTNSVDPKPWMPQRRVPHDNTHRSNIPNYQMNVQTGVNTAQTPLWPKKTSNIIRTHHPPKQRNLENVVEPLPQGKVLCLMRGLPGSGKSTLARKLLPPGRQGQVISTDDFFIQRDGTYRFNQYQLDEAHQSAQLRAKRAMEKGHTPVIIDNTNTQLWEMKPYVQLAVGCNYHVEIREPSTPWREKVVELARRNQHGVPPDKIGRMLERYEKLNSVEDILDAPDKHTKGNKDCELPHRRGQLGNKHVSDRRTNRDDTDPARKITKQPQDDKVSEKDRYASNVKHDVEPLFTKAAEERQFSQQHEPQAADLSGKEKERRDSKEINTSGTDSNLSEIQDVITSIPIASCLKENVSSFQNKLSEFSNFDDLYKSSGSDDILPKRGRTNVDEKVGVKNGEQQRSATCAEDPVTKVTQDAKQMDEKKKQTMDNVIRGVNQILESKHLENSEGSSIDPPSLASPGPLSKESHSHNEAFKDMSDENAKKREKDQSGISELAKYLTPSEPDDECIKLSEEKDKLTHSERDSLARSKETWSGPGRVLDASKTSVGEDQTISQISTCVNFPSHPSSNEHLGVSRMEVHSKEPRVVSGSEGFSDVDKKDSPTEPSGKRDKNEVEVPRGATALEDSNQELTLGSEWELTGAKPKVKRAISQPVALISSEYSSPQPSSPIGESHFQFHSLATVPQAKKRQRRVATPFKRRSLAPTFSVPSLPSLDEPGNLSAISPIDKDYSEDDSKANVKNGSNVMESKLSVAHPSSESHEVPCTNAMQVVSENETFGGMKSVVNSEHQLQTKEQPIKRKVARPLKQPSTPFLSEETRRKAMNLNWSSGAITKEVVSPQKLVVQESTSHGQVEMKHQSSQTDPSHFKFLDKANLASDTDSPLPGLLWIKRVSQREWSVNDSHRVSAKKEETIPHRRKIDQSSMTEILIEGDLRTNVMMLHSIFPHLEEEQVKDVVKDCHGNIQWASEVLIDLNNGITQSTGKGKKKKRKGKKNATVLKSEPQNEVHGIDKSSQTSKKDLLVLKVINDGTDVKEQVSDIDVILSKEWISISDAAASENYGKSNSNRRLIDAGTMADFEEAIPNFDEHLAKLLQSHLDVPFVDVCELLERNKGDYAQTERDLKEMSMNEEFKTQGGQSADLNPSKFDKTSNKKDTVNKKNSKNVGGRTPNAGTDRTKEVDKKPRVVSELSALNLLKEEETASFSDQEASNYQRGRPSPSKSVPSQGRQHRRSRSLPRNRSQTHSEEKKETRDVKPKQKTGTKTGQQKSQRKQNVVTSDKHKNKDADSNDGERKQPKRAGLGKHLATKDEGMSLPNKYSFQDLKRKQKMEENDRVCDGQSPEMGPNHQEIDEKKNGGAEAASASRARATPSDLLDEEGKGVPARFHEGMTFQLDMAFALQLQEIFGSVGYNIDTDVLSNDDLTISVNLQLAKTIHSAWSQSFQLKFEREEKQLLEMMKQDEALAKQLQQEEERKEMEAKQKRQEKKLLGSTPQHPTGLDSAPVRFPLSQGPVAGVKTENFRDIMAVEMAEELGRQMQKEDALSSGASRSMAVTLRKQELNEKYPGVDKSWLENIFMNFNNDFEATVMYIDNLIKETGQPRDVYPDSAAQMARELQEQHATTEQNEGFELVQNRRSPKTERRPPPRQHHNKADDDDDDDDLKKPDKFQSINHPDYHDYRAEANQHYQQRKECFMKASEAFRKGQMEQAAYYSQQGHKHTALLQEANERASEAILVDRNRERDDNTIDLHGLHADEAVLVLERTIQERANRIRYSSPYVRPPSQLYIITGRGVHSRGGVARVKPAVQRYLQSIGFRWTQINDGMLRINLA